jgi:hypothetical protein
MTTSYVVPAGWVETRTVCDGARLVVTFHESRDCPRIKVRNLRKVERPGSAARCRCCSPHDA